MNANLQALVARAVAGDALALSELLNRYGPRVERQLQIGRRWRAVLDAADVMQVTYLEAFLQIGGFRPEQSVSFEAWLARIAQNNLRDAIVGLERQKRLPPERRVEPRDSSASCVELYDRIAATTTTPSRVAARNDIEQLLRAAIDRLPSDYAAAVKLYDLEGKSITDVSAAMRRSTGAVHMLRARAYEKLGELLGTASAWFESRA